MLRVIIVKGNSYLQTSKYVYSTIKLDLSEYTLVFENYSKYSINRVFLHRLVPAKTGKNTGRQNNPMQKKTMDLCGENRKSKKILKRSKNTR